MLKTKSRIFVCLIVVTLLILALTPFPIEAEAKSTRSIVLDNSFWKCCQSLTKKEVKDQLMQSTGIKTDSQDRPKSSSDPASAKQGSFWQSNLMGLLSGGFETSENFQVQCDTELGQVDIAMRQDTKLDTSCLEVVTCSCEAGDKVLNYVHSMQLTPSGTSTQANVELQIKIRVFIPWLFRTQAFSRLDSSLNRQLDSFVASLNGLVGKKLNTM